MLSLADLTADHIQVGAIPTRSRDPTTTRSTCRLSRPPDVGWRPSGVLKTVGRYAAHPARARSQVLPALVVVSSPEVVARHFEDRLPREPIVYLVGRAAQWVEHRVVAQRTRRVALDGNLVLQVAHPPEAHASVEAPGRHARLEEDSSNRGPPVAHGFEGETHHGSAEPVPPPLPVDCEIPEIRDLELGTRLEEDVACDLMDVGGPDRL